MGRRPYGAQRPFPWVRGAFRATCGPWDGLRSTIAGLRGVKGRANAAKQAKSAVALTVLQAGGRLAGELVIAVARSPVHATGTRVVAARSVGPGQRRLRPVTGPKPAHAVF